MSSTFCSSSNLVVLGPASDGSPGSCKPLNLGGAELKFQVPAAASQAVRGAQ